MDVQMPDGTIVTGVPDNITQSELLSNYQSFAGANPAPPMEKEGALYGALANITPSLATGIGGLLQLSGQAADLVTGTAPGEEAGIVRNILGTVMPLANKSVQRAGESLQNIGREAKTAGLQQREQERSDRVDQQEGQLGKLGVAFLDTVQDPALLSSFIFEQIPNTVGSLGGGLLAKVGVKALLKNASEKALAKAGVGGAVGTGIAMQGTDIGYSTYKDIYERLVKEGTPKDEANLIAVQKGRVAAIEAGALSYAASKIPGAREIEKLAFKKSLSPSELAKNLAGSGAKKAFVKGAGKGAFGETVGENIEEVGGQFASNIGKQEVFPETKLTEGLGEASAMATIGGSTLGGTSGGINALKERRTAIDREKRIAEASQPRTFVEPTSGITMTASPVELTDPNLELAGTQEADGQTIYIYAPKQEESTQTEGVPPVNQPLSGTGINPAVVSAPSTGNESLDREAMMAEINGEQLPLAAPPSAPVAQPAQITQTGNVQVTPSGEQAPAPIPASAAQVAQPAQTGNVQPSAEDIVPLDDKGEPIETPKPVTQPKEVLDPNIEAQLAAEPFDPDSIILPPKEEPIVAAPKQKKVKASEKILSAHEFIASLGGLNKNEASEIDQDYAKSNLRIGNKYLYASKGGLSAAEAAAKLKEAKYITDEDNTSVYKVISESLTNPVYSLNDADAVAERQFNEQALDNEERYQKRQAEAANEAKDISSDVAAEQAVEAADLGNFRQQMLDAGYTEQDLNVIGFTKASPELQAEVVALQKEVSAAGLDSVGILETLEGELANQEITRQEYYEKARKRLEQAIREKAVQGGGRDVSQADVQEGAAREEGLTSPSEQELRDQQAEADAADAAQAKADRDAAAKDKADSERKEIAARSEKAAGEFELGKSAEDDLSGQKDMLSTPVQISPEQQKIDALNKFEEKLSQVVPQFRGVKATGISAVYTPRPLTPKQIALIKDLASEAIDLGMPVSLLENISAAGTTRMNSTAAIAVRKGWLILGKDWSASSRAEKLQAIIHELGHSVDNAKARVSEGNVWQKAYDELKAWHDSGDPTKDHPLTYPFGTEFKGKVKLKPESFAQAFAFYFINPVELQTNAPEAYSQIQSLVEGIQNESQRASATSATKTGTAEVKLQPSRAPKGAAVQSDAGEVGSGVSESERVKDRDNQNIDEIKKPSQPNLPDVTGKPKGTTQIPKPLPNATWQSKPEMTWKDTWAIRLFDKNLNLEIVQKEIEKVTGQIRADLDAYNIENRAHGKAESKVADFLDFELRPIINQMRDNKVTDESLTEFLVMRHAEEGNKVIAERNPNRPDRQDGGTGVTYKEREEYFKKLDPNKLKVFESIAKKVDAILNETRNILEDGKVITKENRKALEDMFEFYVPLNREGSEYSLPTPNYRKVGDFLKSRTGSRKKVIDVLSNIAVNREIAVYRVEQERVHRAVYGLFVMNPNPDFAMAVSPDAIKNKAALIAELESFYDLDTAEATKLVDNIMTEPTKEVYNKEKNLVSTILDTNAKYKDFVLPAKVDGKDRFVFFNPKNDRAYQMVQSLKGLDVPKLGAVMRTIAPATRFFSAINTQYNLVFGAWNFARDVQGAMLNLSTTPIANKKSEVFSGTFKALPEIYNALRERSKGQKFSDTSDGSWADFIANGAKVGFKDQFTKLNQSANIVNRELAKLDRGAAKKKAFAMMNWISNVNDVMENAARLSAYRVALDQFKAEASKDGKQISAKEMEGIKGRAADIAKNLTVNFNRKGTFGVTAGSLFAFFNASAQGTKVLYKTLNGPAGKKIMAAGIGIGIIQAIALSIAGFDEDEPSEFIKQKNLIIPYGDGKYAMFPMPFGFNIFPNLGRLFVEGGIKASNGKDVMPKVADTITMLANSFNPLGGGGFGQMFAPTIADPFVAVILENKDAFGRPISREARGTSPKPGYTLSRDPSPSISQFLAEFLNTVSFGNKDKRGYISPTADQLDYLAQQATGGVGREALRLGKFSYNVATGAETPDYQVPIAGKLIGDIKSAPAISQKFYRNVTQMSEHEDAIKGRIKRRENVSQYMRDNPDASLWRRANSIENEISKLNKTRRELMAKGGEQDRIKRIDEQKTRRMKTFNDMVEKRDSR